MRLDPQPEGTSAADVRSADQPRDDTFESLYLAHYRRLVGVLRLDGASLDLAEEIAQEAFVRTFSRWPSVRRGSNPAGYAFRTAFRLLRSSRRSGITVVDAAVLGSTADRNASSATGRLEVVEALQTLSHRQRACVLLTSYAGMSSDETGRTLHISAATVRVHAARGRKKLRELLP